MLTWMRRIPILTIIDNLNGESPATLVDGSLEIGGSSRCCPPVNARGEATDHDHARRLRVYLQSLTSGRSLTVCCYTSVGRESQWTTFS